MLAARRSIQVNKRKEEEREEEEKESSRFMTIFAGSREVPPPCGGTIVTDRSKQTHHAMKKGKPQDDLPDDANKAIAVTEKKEKDNDDDDNIDSSEVFLQMSPLKYSRIMGSLPRDDGSTSLSFKITSSTIGRVVVRPSASSSSPSNNDSRNSNNAADFDLEDYDNDEIDQSLTRIYHVLALGFQDGKIRLVDATTGLSVLFGSTFTEPGAWFVNQTPRRGYDVKQKIIALSFDSTSSYLSSINANGECAVFGPLIWGKQSQRTSPSSGGDGQQILRLPGFMGTLGNNKELDLKTTNHDSETHQNIVSSHLLQRPPFTLVKPLTFTARFNYQDRTTLGGGVGIGGSMGAQVYHPTCMALDPSYARRKERALIVGFDDGRLVLSKLQGAVAPAMAGITSYFGGGGGGGTTAIGGGGGGITVKKIDSVLYHTVSASSLSGDQTGIEALTWRGGLVAWADSSGVRLFDIESMSRIAHIDRPTGARISLYPTISHLKPSLMFEKSDSLLIAWGDCLISLLVNEAQTVVTIVPNNTADGTTPATKVIKRKTVEATMAWEMDCVACGVVPMDERHVAVLGLVPYPPPTMESGEYANDEQDSRDYSIAGGDNTLELQIINRVDGKCISNNRLPLSEVPYQKIGNNLITTGNATEFCLLSSFACPRMDGFAEWDALNGIERGEVERDYGDGTPNTKLPDLHLRWNLDNDVCSTGKEILSEATIYNDDRSVASDVSICSDNYVFALSAPIGDVLPSTLDLPVGSPPPIMAVIYCHDACLVQTRDVDDAISYTRSLGKPALALRQALALRRDVRRHELDELIDDFFIALLRFESQRKDRPLSFSRLKIAAETLPILLGGDPRMWQRWIFMFCRIPGGVFVIREKIPVRDPELPAFVFAMCLEKMLDDAILQVKGQRNVISEYDPPHGEEVMVVRKMVDLLLETMRAWGNTSSLRARVRLQRHCVHNQRWGRGMLSADPFIKQSEKDLHRRISQTAFGVLENAHYSTSSTLQTSSMRQHIDSSKDSLFDVEHLLARLTARYQLNDTDNHSSSNYMSSNDRVGNMCQESVIIFESMAELEVMRERYDRALGYYLSIGIHIVNESSTILEDTAVRAVNSFLNDSVDSSANDTHRGESNKFGFVLSMIELHQLSNFLLKRNYLKESPVVALIALVGLSQAGRFLMDNCSPPEDSSLNPDDQAIVSGSNLPLDVVAEQLKLRPKLLYWFLFQVFVNKADMYVTFPTTAVPPAAIIDFHKIQFSLFVDFAEDGVSKAQDGHQSLPTSMNDRDTPFMAFLKAAIPHGGVQADAVRRSLEKYRGDTVNSPVFARELAFVIENFFDSSIEDAKYILQLYLCGTKNLFLAVSYAERNILYRIALFDMLVEHCTTPDPTSDAANQNSIMGRSFGSLLEAAAHAGSDLASLVSRIPEGMSIEGLRPKLIAAITDYRYKVKIHEYADKMIVDDKVKLMREINHVSRRGERIVSDNRTRVTRTALAFKTRDNSRRRQVSPSKIFSLPVR